MWFVFNSFWNLFFNKKLNDVSYPKSSIAMLESSTANLDVFITRISLL